MARTVSSRENRVARHASIAGGLLFCIYSYLFLTQGFYDQLQVIGSEYSEMLSLRIPLSPWLIALVMVAILQGIQLFIRSIFRVETRFLLITYLPSLAGLLMLVWVDGNAFDEKLVFFHHLIIAGVFVFLLVVWIIKYLLVGDESSYGLRDPISNFLIWRTVNLALFAICVFVIGMLSPMKQSARNEAAMIQAVQANQLFKVLEMDRTNLNPSLRMTQLRNVALLQEGLLGERMFEYPQNYGIQGLKKDHQKEKDGQVSLNYEFRLAHLLLGKHLDDFVSELSNYTQYFSSKKLPKHYLEAYALYVYLHPEKPYLIQDKELRERFVSYLNARNEYRTNGERKSALGTTEFRTTYWWYYDFVDSQEHG